MLMARPSSSTSNGLSRGQACIHCRRRKMKCDGIRPICGQCTRTNRPDDCEYTNGQGRSKVEILEENIARIEARIFELEHPDVVFGEPMHLYYPYTQPEPGPSSPTASYGQETDWWSTSEPPRNIRESLVDRVLEYASDVNFFLNPTHFRVAALSEQALGDPARPIEALMSTVYLWGVHLSGNEALLAHHEVLLSRAVSQVATSLSGTHPRKVIQTIQAEYLLATYFFMSGRFLEGKYHLSAAISIGVAAGFRHLRSSTNSESELALCSPADDPVTEGEYVDCCWTGIFMDKTFAVALGSEPNVACASSTLRRSLDTPWPLEIEDYEHGGYPSDATGSRTIQTFLRGETATCGNEFSRKSLYCKAAIIWHLAYDLVGSWNINMSREQSERFQGRLTSVDGLLETLKGHLKPLSQATNDTPANWRLLFVTHNIVCAGTLQLHGMFASSNASSNRKVVATARSIYEMATEMDGHLGNAASFINPVMGTVWVLASQFVLDELQSMKLHRGEIGQPSAEEIEVQTLIDSGLRAMEPLSRHCALIKYQLHQIQEAVQACC